MKIKEIFGSEAKKVVKWKTLEWKRYEKEAGYKWIEKKHVLAAYDNKNLIGYAEFRIIGGVSYLAQLIVAKEYRRKGVGLMLLKKFESISKKKKCHLVCLRTSERYKTAVPFYIKNDYKKIATLNDYLFHDDWYYFGKRLK